MEDFEGRDKEFMLDMQLLYNNYQWSELRRDASGLSGVSPSRLSLTPSWKSKLLTTKLRFIKLEILKTALGKGIVSNALKYHFTES